MSVLRAGVNDIGARNYDVMKLTNFSFQREPVWILVFSLAPAALGMLAVLLLLLVREALDNSHSAISNPQSKRCSLESSKN
ncbi:MAG TPA: hypothetical protein VGW36_02075 [Pyrinomonadaceae bacterium]|nr:hypothetical protein [Pyrinomonadaceae bacterium]